jgi:hypothetical protein
MTPAGHNRSLIPGVGEHVANAMTGFSTSRMKSRS